MFSPDIKSLRKFHRFNLVGGVNINGSRPRKRQKF